MRVLLRTPPGMKMLDEADPARPDGLQAWSAGL